VVVNTPPPFCFRMVATFISFPPVMRLDRR
jgi:hypothetical protein